MTDTGLMTEFRQLMESLGIGIDAVGVLVVVIGALVATLRFLAASFQAQESYRRYRQDLGRAILLGLEFLVAGDIIRTVVVDPTMENVTVLGMIVLIRTFLSTSLQLEIDGRWPWQRGDGGRSAGTTPT
ncbi:MAG: DUF1622 domain-containing protein [Pirellulales bacterium]|nr:DUF1622 domain-containing protein [Pirellulales bacterium]